MFFIWPGFGFYTIANQGVYTNVLDEVDIDKIERLSNIGMPFLFFLLIAGIAMWYFRKKLDQDLALEVRREDRREKMDDRTTTAIENFHVALDKLSDIQIEQGFMLKRQDKTLGVQGKAIESLTRLVESLPHTKKTETEK